MPLHVLSDDDVRSLLATLATADMEKLFDVLGAAFQTYSTDGEKQYQCHRQGVSRPGAPTMLFMPATLPNGASVKVVGVPPPTSPENGGTKSKGLNGVVLVCDEDGRAVGVLNAAALTAFRTALGSILLYRHRTTTQNIVVFGAGKQALWHVWLALALRKSDIATVTIVNRSAGRAQELIVNLREMGKGAGFSVDLVEFSVMPFDNNDSLKTAVQQADVIFCTTPSTVPLFPREWLTCVQGLQKTRYISAIGSYKLDMQELDPGFLRTITTDKSYPGSYQNGVVVVDSRDACALEAGELVKAGIPDSHLIEIGELLKAWNTGGPEKSILHAWLLSGNVVYKSVGVGIMDLSIGRALIDLGMSRGVGTTIPQF